MLKRVQLFILFMIAFVIPFFIHGVVRIQSEIEMIIYPIKSAPFVVDLFHSGKLWAFSLLMGALVIIFLVRVLKNEVKLNFYWFMVPWILYILFTIISSIVSEYPDIARHGFSDRYMGNDVFIMGAILVLLIIWSIDDWAKLKIVLAGLLFANIPIVIIGILQANDIFPLVQESNKEWIFFGIEPYLWGFVNQFLEEAQEFTPGFNHTSTTFYNQNYMGVYSSVSTVLAVVFYFNENSKNKKWIWLFLSLLCMLNLLLSGSKAGLFTVGIVGIGYLVLHILKSIAGISINVKGWGVLLLFISIELVMFNLLTDGAYSNLIKKTTTGIEEAIIEEIDVKEFNIKDIDIKETSQFMVKEIYFEGNEAFIRNDRSTLRIGIVDHQVMVLNEEMLVDYKEWKVDEFSDYLRVYHNQSHTFFGIMQDEKLGIMGSTGLTREVIKPPELLINGFLFTSRGIIWSKAIEHIINKPLFGHGNDTYPIYTNDQDLVNRMNYSAGQSTTSMSLNPHSTFLLIAFNNGLLALFSFLLFIGVIAVKGLRIYWTAIISKQKSRDEKIELVELTFIPLLSFMIVSISNDLIVATAPMMFLLISGCGWVVRKSEENQGEKIC